MAKFLNTKGLTEWIPKIITNTERELVIITPYMQLSDVVFNCLVEANKRGVETTIVYRENKLSEKDKSKLLSIDNLNLFHHPNVHAKCYYNENYLLIASMNLYAYSEKNNREMGVLLHKIDVPNENKNITSLGGNSDDEEIFNDAVLEIRSIITSSELEKKSRETAEEGFEMEIIKSEKEKVEDFCKVLNRNFIHKKFEAFYDGFNYEARCHNYYDNIDVVFEDRRITLHFKVSDQHLEHLHREFEPLYDEYMFKGFKFYWNNFPKNKAHFYKDKKESIWDSENHKEKWIKTQDGIQQFIKILKPMIIQK